MFRAAGFGLVWLLCSASAWGQPQTVVQAASEHTNTAPAAVLGLPIPIPKPRIQRRAALEIDVRPVGFNEAPATPPLPPMPPNRTDDFAVPPPFRPQEEASFVSQSNYGSDPREARERNTERRSKFGEYFEGTILDGCFQRRDSWFRSDHCFDGFVSPITNPFLFEDPRSLTEIRPLFFIQQIPNGNPTFRGGNAEYFGAQFRLAFSDRFSMVINKLGAVSVNPGQGSAVPSGFGFAEIHLGPKFTFLRDQDHQALGAMGLTFQIPAGRPSVFQDTGSLSLVPYVALAKNILPTRAGSLNVMDTFGYSFATDRQRTNYLFQSFHLDWDVFDRHKFYPLVEINWFYYGRSGTQRTFGTEGRDLANIGSTNVGGRHNLHLALGCRYQFSERFQAGMALEMPLVNRRDMLEYRGTFDFIWRY